MKKIHTRAKKKKGLGTHLQHKSKMLGTKRKTKPKTFKTEESAKKHAELAGIEKYVLKKVKKNKRFQIVEN